MRRAEVVALGLIQGPAELLPVSSSAHVAALPLLLGWEHARAGRARGARRSRSRCTPAARSALAGRRCGASCGAAAATSRCSRCVPPVVAGVRWPSAGSRSGSAAPASLAAGLRGAARRRWCSADRAPGRRAARRTRGRATACCSGSRRRRRWCPGVSRSGRDAARRRGRSGSRGRTPCGSRAGSACRCSRARRRSKGVRLLQRRPGALGARDAGRRRRGGARPPRSPRCRSRACSSASAPLAPWAAYRCALAAPSCSCARIAAR